MSLQVWLPLNGSLENKGLYSGLTVSGTPTYVNGIMGKAISLTPRVTFNNFPKLDKFTILFWAKIDSCTSDWADVIGFTSKQTDGSSAAEFRFEATKTSRACSFHNNSPYAITAGSRILITEAQKGEWHHVGVVYNGESIISYIDGVKTYTDTGLGGYLTNGFHIGETTTMVGGMNDLRIYDNCLSTEQIKEISKGLVLHYPLNNGCGNDNLVTNSLDFSGWSIGGDWTKEVGNDGVTYIKSTRTGATSNNWSRAIPTYQINPNNFKDGVFVSFDFKCDDYSLLNHKCICSLQNYNESNTRIGWREPNEDLKTKYVNGENLKDGVWTRIGRHFTYAELTQTTSEYTSSDVAYSKLSFQLVQNGTIYIKRVKLEKR